MGEDIMTNPTNPIAELREVLGRAASQAVREGVDLDDFMRFAWQSYMDAKPGLREQLEDLRISAEIAAMRQLGKVGLA
jgi:hypothetical protein